MPGAAPTLMPVRHMGCSKCTCTSRWDVGILHAEFVQFRAEARGHSVGMCGSVSAHVLHISLEYIAEGYAELASCT